MKKRLFVLVLSIFSVLGCSGPVDESSGLGPLEAPESAGIDTATSELRVPTLPAARASLLAADAKAANEVSLRGVDGFLASLDDDAVLLARREPLLSGKAAIAEFFATHPIGGTFGWRHARADVSALGDFGYTLGWTQTFDPPDTLGNVNVRYGLYAAAWRRSLAASAWKIHAFLRVELPRPNFPPPAGMLPVSGDGPVYPRPRSTRETARELSDTDAAFAAYTAQVGQQAGFDAYVANAGLVMDDPFIFGREAIFANNAGVPPSSTLSWAPAIARGATSSDLGLTIGFYEARFIDEDGSPGVAFGKYFTLWQRQADGKWRFIVDGGSSSPAPAP